MILAVRELFRRGDAHSTRIKRSMHIRRLAVAGPNVRHGRMAIQRKTSAFSAAKIFGCRHAEERDIYHKNRHQMKFTIHWLLYKLQLGTTTLQIFQKF
jgi:hypothetical protein